MLPDDVLLSPAQPTVRAAHLPRVGRGDPQSSFPMNAPLPATSRSRAFMNKPHLFFQLLPVRAPHLSSKVHFSSLGSAVTGLHCIGSMNAGSVRFRIVWCFLVFLSACSIFLGAPTWKGQIDLPRPDFPGQFNQQHLCQQPKPPAKTQP
jgi:hypothetical protein